MAEEKEYFKFKKVDFNDKEMMQQLYRLRFDVYCHECNFIKAEDYPQGFESDEYDPQSVHFAAINDFNEVIGTLRIILPRPLPLPIRHHCPNLILENEENCIEISRLVISRKLRRRVDDKLYYGPQVEDKIIQQENKEFMRRAKPMAFGLYREMYRECKARGITHWYTLMEKPLRLLLSLHGFKFNCVGDAVDFYGPVYPHLGKTSEIEEEVKKKFPQFFDYFVEQPKG